MFTILVEPIAEKDIWITLLKRPLENAIKNAAGLCNNLPEFINMVKTKRYTRNKIAENINLLFTWNYKKRYGVIKKNKTIC